MEMSTASDWGLVRPARLRAPRARRSTGGRVRTDHALIFQKRLWKLWSLSMRYMSSLALRPARLAYLGLGYDVYARLRVRKRRRTRGPAGES